VPAGGGDSASTLRAGAGGCGRVKLSGTVVTPRPTTAVALAEHFAVLRDMFGQAPSVRIGIPGISREIQPVVERPEAVCQINVAAVVGVIGPGFDSYTWKRYKRG